MLTHRLPSPMWFLTTHYGTRIGDGFVRDFCASEREASDLWVASQHEHQGREPRAFKVIFDGQNRPVLITEVTDDIAAQVEARASGRAE